MKKGVQVVGYFMDDQPVSELSVRMSSDQKMPADCIRVKYILETIIKDHLFNGLNFGGLSLLARHLSASFLTLRGG